MSGADSPLSLKSLQNLGFAVRRLPVLSVSAVWYIAAPAGIRYLAGLREVGLEDAHWAALGDGLVRFFQESGPVLTKLGQILAARSDLLPREVCHRLEALYDRQPSMSSAELKRLLRAHYGRFKKSPFASFDERALAVGSVGQVHRATLHDGAKVIVKLIRPGAGARIQQDVRALMTVADAVFSVLGRPYRSTWKMVRRVMEDLEKGFLSELNLDEEARALAHFRKRAGRNSPVYIPKVYSELSSTQVLVVEEIKGEPLSRFRDRDGRGADGGGGAGDKARRRLAETALREILTQIFERGIFHADPHAGNFIVMEDGRLGLIDFGLTGEFSGEDRKKLAKAIRSLLARDADGVMEALLGFASVPSDFKRDRFKAEIAALIKKSGVLDGALGKGEKTAGAASSASVKLDVLVNELFKITYRHQLYIPRSTTLLIKTLVTIEGVARTLDPDIKLHSVAAPVVLRSLTPRWLRLFSA